MIESMKYLIWIMWSYSKLPFFFLLRALILQPFFVCRKLYLIIVSLGEVWHKYELFPIIDHQAIESKVS